MKDWNATVEPSSSFETPTKGTSPDSSARGSMTSPSSRARFPSYSSPASSTGTNYSGGEAALEKLNRSLSEFVMTNFSEVLEQEHQKHEVRFNAKLEEMVAMQDAIDELTGKVANLTNTVKGLEDDKCELEREVDAQNKEIMRIESESDSMKAYMKQSLNL